ncbi:AraC family transcriptional regulator [Roseiconus lacunae]|uniref:AraC family transcriptional regulator n=1 Tax=Roseiconus lacunae TaxID=2605694 RepID=A0ABT7PRP2_9BACT|nr:AraC family transcriptional regulator [Roseiconus lacunae]MCD0462625.1 AraC family transcriptional regulator [Roseiconus lacunae]MDM4019170.1 AraC family transcriptional regulator [Roseiconus lacunae]WRQ49024.1 AraC family transcriptional regulator [Stieleria sp. HD01]
MTPLQNDPITELISRLYLPGWCAALWRLSGNWGIEVPEKTVSLYVVTQGSGWLVFDSPQMSPIRVISGDHVMTASGEGHRFVKQFNNQAEPVAERLSSSFWPTAPASQDDCEVVYAQFELEQLAANPLSIGLPNLVHLNHRRDAELKSCLPLVDLMQQTAQDGEPGWQAMVRKLSELVFIRTLSAQLRMNSSRNDGSAPLRVVKAMTDTVVGPVLNQVLASPESQWTVPQMARMARVSKSAFSDRFRNLLGQPPLQYVTDLRMQKASRLLHESNLEISNIAVLVGYESPSSFSTAFRRWNGQSPAEFRRHRKASESPIAATLNREAMKVG